MFISMLSGAALALWTAIGLALIGWMGYAYSKDKQRLGVLIMIAAGWLCATGVIAWSML